MGNILPHRKEKYPIVHSRTTIEVLQLTLKQQINDLLFMMMVSEKLKGYHPKLFGDEIRIVFTTTNYNGYSERKGF